MTLTRRQFVGTSLATLVASCAKVPLSGQGLSLKSSSDAVENLLPVPSERPRIRWWWPGGYIDPVQIDKEVKSMAEAGFGGFEIADVRDGVNVPMDPKRYGWSTDRWIAGVDAALEAAIKYNIKADITLGAHWPTGIPGVTPNHRAAAKELVYSEVVIQAGESFSAPIPKPAHVPSGLHMSTPQPLIIPELICALAFKQSGMQVTSVELDPQSMVDVTSKIADQSLTWQAPDKDTWHLLFFWMQGTGQTQNLFDRAIVTSMLADPIPYAVDIYGVAGTQVCIDFWENRLLSQKTKSMLRQIGGDFFEDSLELKAVKHWSPDLPATFEANRGYEIYPYLPLLAEPAENNWEFGPGMNKPKVKLFVLKEIDTDQFESDFQHTLTEMYALNRIRALSEWAKTLGMGMRAQCSGLAATYCSTPEGDNGDTIDSFSAKAAARDIGGHKVLSDEAATFVGGQAHVADWKLLTFMLQRDFAGGVNQVVLHGYSYADSPDARWPGFSAFGRAIGNDWGPRSPLWTHAGDTTAYLARLQSILQSGLSQADVAVLDPTERGDVAFNVGREGSEFGEMLRKAGYTRHHVTEDLLSHPNAIVEKGVLTPLGAGYKALLVMPAMQYANATLKRLVDYVENGLPVIFIGQQPSLTPELSAHENVKQAMDFTMAIAMLNSVSVIPSVGFSREARIMPVLRRDGTNTHYYLLNDSDAPVALTVSLAGTGSVVMRNLWQNRMYTLPDSKVADGRVEIALNFAPNEAKVLSMGEQELAAAEIFPVATGDVLATINDPWMVELEAWGPGATPTRTNKVKQTLTLPSLRAWHEIPQIGLASGIAKYKSFLSLPSDLPEKSDYLLDLGRVGGSCRLWVNQQRVWSLAPFSLQFDIAGLLQKGKNVIEVEVATTLNNQLLKMGEKAIFGLPGMTMPTAAFSELWQPQVDASPVQPPKGEYLGAPILSENKGPGPSMAPGAGNPGGERSTQVYGLIGPVRLLKTKNS
ncbi:hypothetical protein FJ444_04450 [Aestuariibacter sp. GS-14]|uniref:glycosyl hydrolase n=1 Tax=Aestuariibacter sp. GS-14 TaxID=2590670 RepID=UPI001129A1E1|nr:glycosyl hydrolase [Aestuariibacter sp. GS-14]TPV60877.1 hypothetical protein FJ444_04450 [Aestuariibacter sp. GS-14]